MQSAFQFPVEVNFPQLHQEPAKEGRHQTLVSKACERTFGENVFVDCSSSVKYLSYGTGVTPPIVPNHPYYSTALQRYLSKTDMLQCQGLWESIFKPSVYKKILDDNGKHFAQNLAGNSFSSTVCLAATLAAFMLGPGALRTLPTKQAWKRRLRGKQSSSAFAQPVKNRKLKAPNSSRYRRKRTDMDSRTLTSSGKSKMVSIWDKEKVCLPRLLKHSR